MGTLKCCWFVLPCLLLLSACATPGRMRSADADNMARMKLGMTVKQAQRTAGTAGEPVALFLDKGRRCEMRKFVAKESGAPYCALWIGDALQGVLPAEQVNLPEPQHLRNVEPPALRPGEGFDSWLAPFSKASPPSAVDFTQLRNGFRPRDKERERAEMKMWAPVVVVLLPVMPFQLASVGKAAAGHAPFYALDLGWSPERVRKKIGEPKATSGDPSEYGVWAYRYEPYEFDPLDVSIGFRGNAVEWVRYGYYANMSDEPGSGAD